MVLHGSRFYSTYSDYSIRENEIYASFECLLNIANSEARTPPVLEKYCKLMITRYPEKDEKSLRADAKRALIYELLGYDKFKDTAKEYFPDNPEKPASTESHYPYRILSHKEYEKLIFSSITSSPEGIKELIEDIALEAELYCSTIVCSDNRSSKYKLTIMAKQLFKNPKPNLCFIDEKTGTEIGRFTLTSDGLIFKAYGDNIDLEIDEPLDYPSIMFENPKGNINLNANWKLTKPIYLAADVNNLNIQGHIHSTQPLRIDVRGQLNVDKSSKIESTTQTAIRASTLDLQGQIASDNVCQLEIISTIEMAPESKCTAGNAVSISAAALKDIRGSIDSTGYVKIETTDGIYLHGGAEVRGTAGLAIKSKSLFTTDKASVSTEGKAQFSVAANITVEKESAWSISELNMASHTFKNYSPNFKVNKGAIHSSHETINYSTGVIKAKEFLRFSGDSVWNGGLIDFGQGLSVKLNKFFAHGIISLSDLKNIRKVIKSAKLQGGDINIIAGVVLDVLGTKKVRTLILAAIAEINIAYTTSVSTRKSRLIALDAGIDLPDIHRTCEDIYDFCRLIQSGDYQAIFNNIATRNRLISAINFARWGLRNLLPGAGATIDMIWSGLILLSTTPKLYADYCDLCNKYRNKKIETSDLISLIATASNFAIQAATLESQIVSLLPPEQDPDKSKDTAAPVAEEKKQEPVSSSELKAPEPRPLIETLPPLALDFASLFMPCSTEEAVLEAKMGGIQANATILDRTGMSFEWLSTRLGLNVTDIFYQATHESTATCAGKVSEVGHSLSQSGTTLALTDSVTVTEQIERRKVYAHFIDWRNTRLDEKAEVTAATVNIVSQDESKLAGKMTTSSLFIKSKTLEQTFESKIEVKDTEIVEAEKAIFAGDQKADVVYVKTSEATQLAETGHVTAKRIAMNGGKDVKILGTLSATDAPIETKSEDGKPITEPALNIMGTAVLVGKSGHLEASHGVSVVNADQAEVDGTDEAKTVVINTQQSTKIASDATVKGDEVDIDAGKKFTLDSNGLVQATGESKTTTSQDGTTTTNPVLRIHASEVNTEAESKITAANGVSVIDADQATIGGADEAKTVVITTQQSTEMTSNGSVKGDKVDIDAGKKFTLDRNGLVQATGESKKTTSQDGTTTTNPVLRIKADEVKTEAESKITATNGVTDINSVNAVLAGDVSGTSAHIKVSSHLDAESTAHLTATAADGTIAIEASTASLGASINAFDVFFKIDHIPDIQDLLLTAGIYKNINPASMLSVWTQDAVTLDRSISVKYGFALSAAGITVKNDLYSKGNIILNARNGDVRTECRTYTTETSTTEIDYSKVDQAARSHGLSVQNLFATDALGNFIAAKWIPMRTITTTETHDVPCSIHSDQVLSISASSSYFNDKCLLSGTEFYIDVQGSAINHAGTWAASQYLQIHAEHGNIENQCIVYDIQGKYDIMNSYEIAHILGGTGAGHDGVGFAAICGGKLINDASEISSIGSNSLNAKLGIDSLSRYHQYLSYEKHSRNFWGRETVKRDTSTQVQASLIYSAQGKNTLVSEGGDIHSLSTQFIAPLGNTLAAGGNVLIEGIVAEDKHYESSSALFGLIRHDVTEGNPFAVPTALISMGDISITSLQDVMLTNFAVYTPGTLNLSGKNILISAPILQNTRKELSCTFGFSGPQFPCQNSVPLYSDLQSLSHSRGSTEWAANSWNTVVDGANTVNGLIAGLRAGSLANAIFPTSSMTLAELDYTRTATRTRWQTVAPGVGAQVGGLVMNAINDLSITNGVPIFDSGDAQIHAKRFLQQGAALHSSISSDTETLGTGVSVEGDPTFSLTASRSGTVATQYANQLLQVGGTLSIDVHEWDMDAANLIAGTLTGHADILSIQSRADTSSSYIQCAQINSNGNFSYQQGGHDSAKISVVSGIRAGSGSSFSVDDTSLIGGKITFDALDGFSTKTLQSQSIAEHDKSSSYGICGNINDMTGDTASRQWSQAIPYVGLQRGMQDWQATQYGTLYGTHGGAASIQVVNGALNTTDESGLRVVRDDSLCYEVKVPIYNRDGIKQLSDNVIWLGDRLKPSGAISHLESPAYVAREDKHKTAQQTDDDMPELIDESDDDMPELIDEQEVEVQHSTHASKDEREVADDFLKSAEEIANMPIPLASLDYRQSSGNGVRFFERSVNDEEKQDDVYICSRKNSKWKNIISADQQAARTSAKYSPENKEDAFLELTHEGLNVGIVSMGAGEQSSGLFEHYLKNGEKIFRNNGIMLFSFDATTLAMKSINSAHNKDYFSAKKDIFDIGMGALGFFGPGGFIASSIYTGVDATIGWDAALKNYKEVDDSYKRITGKNYFTYTKML